jgi:hypothetical protein
VSVGHAEGLIRDKSEGVDGDGINSGVGGKGSNPLAVTEDSVVSEGAEDTDIGVGVRKTSRRMGRERAGSVEMRRRLTTR